MTDAEPGEAVPGAKIGDGPEWANHVERLARAVAFGGIVAYALGLFVVNAYLFRLGVSDFSLLRPKLVYTGVLVIGFLATSVGLVVLIRFALATVAPKEAATTSVQRAGRSLAIVVLGLGSLLGPVFFLSVILNADTAATEWRVTGLLLGGGALLTLMVLGLRGRGEDRWKGLITDPIVPFTLVTIIVGYLLVVAWFVYPVVPEQFGGGQPRAARLVLAADSVDGFGPLGLTLSSDGVSDCVELVFTGEESYVVRLADDKVLEIARDGVRAVLIDLEADGRCPPADD